MYPHIHTHTFTHAYSYTYTHTCTHAYTVILSHVHTCTVTHMHPCIHSRAVTHAHTCTLTRARTHSHVYTHMHTHTLTCAHTLPQHRLLPLEKTPLGLTLHRACVCVVGGGARWRAAAAGRRVPSGRTTALEDGSFQGVPPDQGEPPTGLGGDSSRHTLSLRTGRCARRQPGFQGAPCGV